MAFSRSHSIHLISSPSAYSSLGNIQARFGWVENVHIALFISSATEFSVPLLRGTQPPADALELFPFGATILIDATFHCGLNHNSQQMRADDNQNFSIEALRIQRVLPLMNLHDTVSHAAVDTSVSVGIPKEEECPDRPEIGRSPEARTRPEVEGRLFSQTPQLRRVCDCLTVKPGQEWKGSTIRRAAGGGPEKRGNRMIRIDRRSSEAKAKSVKDVRRSKVQPQSRVKDKGKSE
ncbi:hypothetical protein C8R43DRAFT_949162 [Mycena crocata]|nr:hypothetical protein C8R43DRAFT_949162 [Mycena crocata]